MFGAWVVAYRKWQDERRAIAALAKLTDERLRDIGLHRGDLERAVRFGHWS